MLSSCCEDESVGHVFLECEGYERERWEMMQPNLQELGSEVNERVEKRGKEWMMLLVGPGEESTVGIIEAVKKILERV